MQPPQAPPVVGWPPIRSFRRNFAPQPKVAAAPSCNPPAPAADPGEKKINTMFVKVNVDGVPIGRKINLKAYDSYEKLSVALDEMFRGSINGGAVRISKRSPDLAGLGVVGTLHKTIVPMTAIGALLLDKSGRRPLLMVSAGVMSIGCFLVGLSFYIQGHGTNAHLAAIVSTLALGGLLCYIATYSLGMGGIPWIIMSEIFPINMKGISGSLVTPVSWFGSCVITITFNSFLSWSATGRINYRRKRMMVFWVE